MRIPVIRRGAPLSLLALALAGAAPAHAQSLDALIERALSGAPTIEAARAREDAARAAADAARAERGPTLTLEGQVGAGRLDPGGYFGLSADDVYPRAATATFEWPLFTGGRTGSAIKAADLGAEVAALQMRMAASSLRVDIAGAYAGGIAAARMVQHYEALVATLDEALRQAKLIFKAGDGTSTEVAQAEARLAEARGGLAGARADYAAELAQLGALVGAPVVLDDSLPGLPFTPASRDEAVAVALRDNPAMIAAERAVALADAKRSGAKAGAMPMVGAYAEAATVRDQFFPGYKGDSASVGLRARWTIFDNGRTGAAVRGADADLRAAMADRDQRRLVVEQQAATAFDQLVAARAMLNAAQARTDAAVQAERGTRLEVKAGAKPPLAALDAARETIMAEAALARAQGQLLVAAYRLRAVCGMDGDK